MDKIAAEAADKICNAVNMEMHDSISYAPREQILTIVEAALSQALAARDAEIRKLVDTWRAQGSADFQMNHAITRYGSAKDECSDSLEALLKGKAI